MRVSERKERGESQLKRFTNPRTSFKKITKTYKTKRNKSELENNTYRLKVT